MAAQLTPPMNAPEPLLVPDVYRGICQVAKAISRDGVSKGGKNQQQGYSFRGIDDIYNALSALLSGADLCILPRMLSRTQEERTTAKGGVLFYVTVQADFDFVSARDGSRHTVTMYGEAMDSADKATNKAMSAAYKYCCMQTFCIPTEGMADADATTHQPAPRAPMPIRPPQPAAAMTAAIPEEHEAEVTYEDAPDDEQPTIEEQLQYSIQAERQKRLDAFSALKARYMAIGFTRTFSAVLGLYGAETPGDFPDTAEGLAQARKCYAEMLADVRAREVRGR
jgi:hypothetical protein